MEPSLWVIPTPLCCARWLGLSGLIFLDPKFLPLPRIQRCQPCPLRSWGEEWRRSYVWKYLGVLINIMNFRDEKLQHYFCRFTKESTFQDERNTRSRWLFYLTEWKEKEGTSCQSCFGFLDSLRSTIDLIIGTEEEMPIRRRHAGLNPAWHGQWVVSDVTLSVNYPLTHM